MKRYIRLLALVLIVFLMFSVISVSASIKTDEKYFMDMFDDIDLTYEDEIKPHFFPEFYEGKLNVWTYYNMLYAHNVDVDKIPEYVVFIAGGTGGGEPATISKILGYCLVFNYSREFPYDLAHYVYVPSLQKVYTLEEAYYSEEFDISDAMRSGCVGLHRGDINYDRSCDISDATIIQRYLANFSIDSEIKVNRMDLDGSKNVSIIDATKLQRYIAKIDDSFTVASIVE